MFGRQVFMGYFHDEERTRQAIDGEGWLHTGDRGRTDSDGYLYLEGRLVGMCLFSSDKVLLACKKNWRVFYSCMYFKHG